MTRHLPCRSKVSIQRTPRHACGRASDSFAEGRDYDGVGGMSRLQPVRGDICNESIWIGWYLFGLECAGPPAKDRGESEAIVDVERATFDTTFVWIKLRCGEAPGNSIRGDEFRFEPCYVSQRVKWQIADRFFRSDAAQAEQ